MGVFRFHQYQVVGRALPTENEDHPKIYRMKLWATNEVRAKSKFWYFLRKLKKVKKSNGQILAINEVVGIVDLSEILKDTLIKPSPYDSSLDDDGFESYFGRGKWCLKAGCRVVAHGVKEKSLYTMQLKLCRSGDVNTMKEVPAELWHKRLGHME